MDHDLVVEQRFVRFSDPESNAIWSPVLLVGSALAVRLRVRPQM